MSIVSSKLKTLRDRRIGEAKKRRSYFPAFIVMSFLWISLLCTIIFVDPTNKGAVELFFGLLWASCLFTFSLLFGKTRRGFLVSLGVVLFLFLLYIGVGSLVNLLLIVGAIGLFEYYFSKSY